MIFAASGHAAYSRVCSGAGETRLKGACPSLSPACAGSMDRAPVRQGAERRMSMVKRCHAVASDYLGLQLDYAPPHRDRNGLGTILGPKLVHDVLDVDLD